MTQDIGTMLFYLLPTVLVAAISFYFFKMHVGNEDKRRTYLLHLENQKKALPLRLQAYERMTLFLERISPANLLLRIKPVDEDPDAYAALLIATIEQEFEHNLAQQIYLSQECWNVIRASKNATINAIRKAPGQEEVKTTTDLRQYLLSSLMDQEAPSETALGFIKKEVRQLF